MRVPAQERPDLDIARTASGRGVGLVPDEHAPGSRVADEGPTVPVRAALELSRLDHVRHPHLSRPRATPGTVQPICSERVAPSIGCTTKGPPHKGGPSMYPRSGVANVPPARPTTWSPATACSSCPWASTKAYFMVSPREFLELP